MIWILRAASTQDPTSPAVSFTPNGEVSDVLLQDQSVDIGKWELGGTARWTSGRHVIPDNVPDEIRMSFSHSGGPRPGSMKLPDFAKVHFANVVSDEFRQILENHDPGCHQFIPVRVVWNSGEMSEKSYYWMAPGNRVFALDPENTHPPMRAYQTGEGWMNPHADRPALRFNKVGAPAEEWRPAFVASKIGTRDLFCDGEFVGMIFVSDLLKNAIEAADLQGMDFLGPFPSTG